MRLACGVRQVLVHWKGQPVASATWEDVDSFLDKFPAFQLEDELLVVGGEMSCGAAPTARPGEPVTSIAPQPARASKTRTPRVAQGIGLPRSPRMHQPGRQEVV
jgi:hypothetical protein